MKALNAITAAERAEALAAREREIEETRSATVGSLTRQIGAANDEAKESLEAARKLVEARASERSQELAKEIAARVDPLIAQFVHAVDAKGKPASPRTTALELARVWRELAAKAREEIGDDIDERHLGHALVALLGENEAVLAASIPDFWHGSMGGGGPAEHVGRLSRVMLSGAPAPAIEDAIRQADVAIATRLTTGVRGDLLPARLTVQRSHGSRPRATTAVTAFDEARERERQDAAMKSAGETMAAQERRRDAERRERFAPSQPAPFPKGAA